MLLAPLFVSLRRASWLGAPLNLLLLLALAALLAHWTWRFAAPVPPLPASDARADIKPGAQLATLRAAHLFGAARGAADARDEPVTSLNLKLRGVFAALGGQPAMAILGVDGQDQAVATGYEIVPGVVVGNPHYLQARGHQFLTLFTEAPQARAGLVIVHGIGVQIVLQDLQPPIVVAVAALASLGGDSLVVAWLDPRRVVGAALGALPAGPTLDGILTNELPAWTGLAVRAHGDGLEVLLTSPALESGRAATNRPSTLVSRLPATTLVAAEAHDLGLAIGDLVKRLGADPRTADAAKQLELALGTLGGLDSFTAWMGDGALVVTGQGGTLDGGLVVSVVDEAAAAARLASLRSLLSLAGGVAGIEIRDEAYGAGRITSIDLGDPRRLLGGAAPGAAPLPAGAGLPLRCPHRHHPAHVAIPAEALASLAGDLR